MKNSKKQANGFTLIEVAIVVAIIGIITAIALPSYQNYVLRGHRVDARNVLQSAAQRLEQNYSATRRYNQNSDGNTIDDSTLNTWGLSQSPAGGTARYNISFVTAPTATEYTLQAVPVGAQRADDCGTFTINQSNVRTANGTTPRAEISRRCWTR